MAMTITEPILAIQAGTQGRGPGQRVGSAQGEPSQARPAFAPRRMAATAGRGGASRQGG